MYQHKTFRKLVKSSAIGLALSSSVTLAEEGGSGHYMPGSMASFIDGIPSEPTFLMRFDYINYQASSNITLPKSAGLLLEPEAKINAFNMTVLWAPDWDLGLGEKWQFAMAAAIPVLNMDLSGGVSYQGVDLVHKSGDRTALGDILLMPFIFNYNVNKDLNINARLGIYAPTGSYELGRFINNGKNFWTVEPTIGVVYFGQTNGIEASLYFGADFNQENPDTNYKSGTQIHFDGTLAQHFPFLGGISGVGVTAYYYKQVTDDSGSGATLGDFRAKAAGVGPVVSWISKTGEDIVEIKYIKDYENEKRLDGDSFWIKYVLQF